MSAATTSDSALMSDIDDIIKGNRSGYRPNIGVSAYVHTTDGEYGPGEMVQLVGLRVIRDYECSFGDYIEATFMSQLGTFIHDIYPYIDNCEVVIRIQRQKIVNGSQVTTRERYKAIYLTDRNSNIPTTLTQSRVDLNQMPPITFTVQLLDRGLEVLRHKTFQGCFDTRTGSPSMNPKAFINSVLVNECGKITVESNKIIDRISIDEPDNTDAIKNIIIPSGTLALNVPIWLQEKSSGVYNSGIGVYLQPYLMDRENIYKTMFVYSMYNGGKYHTNDYKAVLYSPMTSQYSLSDNQYTYEDKILRMLSTNISNIPKYSGSYINNGTGFRSSQASVYLNKPVDVTPNGPVFNKVGTNNEVAFEERPDGNNFAKYRGITANNFKLISDVIKGKVYILTAEVTQVDPDIIYPSMPIKVVHEEKDGRIRSLYGTIIRVITQYSNTKGNMLTSMYEENTFFRTNTVIHIAITEES